MKTHFLLAFATVLILVTTQACTPRHSAPRVSVQNMESKYSPAWRHGEITNIVDDVFFVQGTNIIVHDGARLQSSRNMIIVRENNEITLINTVRLNDDGLKALEKLGPVKNIVRIGAFHGRDDAFYQDRYDAKLWAYSSMEFSHGERVDFDLANGMLPLSNAELFSFGSTAFPEGLIVLNIDGGILVSCDSIKNWTKKDAYFDDATFALMQSIGAIGEALIDSTWREAMKPSQDEIASIATLPFVHLVSAHGEPLLKTAKAAVIKSIGVSEQR